MRRCSLIAGLVLVASLAAPITPPTLAATGGADWNQWGGNGGQTWSNDAETAISPSNASTLHLVWSRAFHFKRLFLPAVVGGSAYAVVCCHRESYCSGERLVGIPLDQNGVPWKYGDEFTGLGNPSVGRGVVFVFDDGCSVSDPTGHIALRTSDGTVKWYAGDYWSSSVLNRGREYIAGELGPNGDDPYTLTARDQSSGSLDWTYGPVPVDHELFLPRAAGNAVYVAEGTSPSSITALSASDGSFRWNVPGLVPVAATRDVVYGSIQDDFGAESSGITALDPVDGSVLWSRSGFDPHPLGAFSSALDVVTTPNGLLGLDPSDGSTIWTLTGAFGQPTIANGAVFVRSGTADAMVVLDGSTGAQLTTIPGKDGAVVANGWVFTTTNHSLNAFAP